MTPANILLLGADFYVGPLYVVVTWREWVLDEWVEKTRKITKDKGEWLARSVVRLKEIQQLALN